MTKFAYIQLTSAQGTGGDKLRPASWIEVQLVGEDGAPIPNETYAITLPGGNVVNGSLDRDGKARVEPIPPGTCKVSFPKLDQDAWTAVETES
ncbi:MAG: hypothetical protein JOZ54_20915 [Acidobacteria bacterium]|nr:hypothetical protein [Acidobacteriota bacterium]